jgi:hypothetical protein
VRIPAREKPSTRSMPMSAPSRATAAYMGVHGCETTAHRHNVAYQDAHELTGIAKAI